MGSGFSQLAAKQIAATRDAFGREGVIENAIVPVTPISVAIDVWAEWVRLAPRVAGAALSPESEGLVLDDDAISAVAKRVAGSLNLWDAVTGKTSDAVDEYKKIGAALADIGHADSPLRVVSGMRVLEKYQTGTQQPITAWLDANRRVGQALEHWVLNTRFVSVPQVAVLHARYAESFWQGIRRTAVAADGASRRTISLESRIDEAIAVAKQRGRVVSEWVGEKAADLTDYGAELAGRAAFSFASASGVIALLAVGAGVYWLASPSGAAVTKAVV